MTEPSLPGNPYAQGPDNYRSTLHDEGKSHLAYEIGAILALAYEQRTANLIALAALDASIGMDPSSMAREAYERMGGQA
ncbi:hypothetical protein [Zhihengliuella flava]|uniref:Uncharacterized protein n=1 Tax=Zhihengliuella flava TaxID=1285193 RepID=A0A931GJY7_9MICC|nr:hypothetical protein [Zhihengliuella flava]MBG6085836.1 hypothetical protein [Zhihengliuella flava]